MRIFCCLVLALLIQYGQVLAQRSKQHFYHIGIEDGLSQSSIQDICQDHTGFLWFATKDGLNRYDGSNFVVYKNIPGDTNSIVSNDIIALAVDSLGYIWAGSPDGFVDRFDPATGVFEHMHYLPEPVTPAHIESIFIDRDDNVWICTSGNGLIKYDRAKGTFRTVIIRSSGNIPVATNYVMDMCQDSLGNYWMVLDRNGVFWMDAQTEATKQYHITDTRSGDIVKSFNTIVYDQNGELWVGSYDGAFAFNAVADSFVLKYPKDRINPTVVHILPYEKDVLWLSAFGSGIVKYNTHTGETQAFDHVVCNSRNNVFSLSNLFKDRTGNIWIGTSGAGAYRINGVQNFTLYTVDTNDPFSIQHNSVRAILIDRYGRTYVASYAGLSIFDNQNDTSKHFAYTAMDDSVNVTNKLRNSAVYSLLEDFDGNIWIGLEGFGLHVYNPVTNELKYYNPSNIFHDSSAVTTLLVYSIYQDEDSTIWLGTVNGLMRYNKATDDFSVVNLQFEGSGQPIIRHITQDNRGNFWIATNSGIIFYNKHTGYSRHIRQVTGNHMVKRTAVNVFHILPDDDNTLWVSTSGYGLVKATVKYSNDSLADISFTPLLPDKLGDQVIYATLKDDNGHLWFSSNTGLYTYDPESGDLTNYTVNDGLQSNEFNSASYYKAKDGTLYFGGISGLNSFDPSRIRDNRLPPNVVITGVQVFGEPRQINSEEPDRNQLKLNYTENFLTINFAALDFTAPEKNRYEYMLEGFNNDWMQVGTKRNAEFTNLPPGRYIFRVKGSNSDGVWSNKDAELNIIITPPVWQTVYFKLLAALAILTIVFTALRMWYQQQKRSHDKLVEKIKTQEQSIQLERLKNEYAVTKAMIEGQNNEQKRISEDLHDGLGQTLTAASLNLAALENDLPGLTKRQSEYLVSLKQLLNSAVSDVRNISHNLMPNLLAEEGLEAVLDELCNRTGKSANLKIMMKITGFEKRLDAGIEIAIYRMVQEIINNVIKHASAKNLNISLERKSNLVLLTATDDGIGFSQDQQVRKGIGLKNIKVRTELLKGSLNIHSQKGKGTTIEIEIPLAD